MRKYSFFPESSCYLIAMTAYGHEAGQPIECLSIAVELRKEEIIDQNGQKVYFTVVTWEPNLIIVHSCRLCEETYI